MIPVSAGWTVVGSQDSASGSEEDRRIQNLNISRARNGWVVSKDHVCQFIAKTDTELIELVRDLVEGLE